MKGRMKECNRHASHHHKTFAPSIMHRGMPQHVVYHAVGRYEERERREIRSPFRNTMLPHTFRPFAARCLHSVVSPLCADEHLFAHVKFARSVLLHRMPFCSLACRLFFSHWGGRFLDVVLSHVGTTAAMSHCRYSWLLCVAQMFWFSDLKFTSVKTRGAGTSGSFQRACVDPYNAIPVLRSLSISPTTFWNTFLTSFRRFR